MLKKINQELGITLIIIEHFMKVLTALSSRMMIIENGKLICIGSPEDVMSNQKVIDCYLGKSYA
jgi:branched-chain amino acid transport system ATP-binding protein